MSETFQKQISANIAKTAPKIVGTIINFSARTFVAIFRFIGQMFRDALGK